MRRIISGILTLALTLFIGLSVFATAPSLSSSSSAQAYHGDDYHEDWYYEWERTGARVYYYNWQYAGYRCEYRVYKVYRTGYREFVGYYWRWC